MERFDAVLVGGGIMSATLGTLLQELEPTWRIALVEKLPGIGEESSNAWNNAGTGHSALCELNYTPQRPDGSIAIDSAVEVNEQFQVSRQFWTWLVNEKIVPDPASFLSLSPHMSFVWGTENVNYLRARYEALKDHPLFLGLEYSEDPMVIARWAPVLIDGRRKGELLAATRAAQGTDIDFGALTRSLMSHISSSSTTLFLESRVKNLTRTQKRVGGPASIRGGLHPHHSGNSLRVRGGRRDVVELVAEIGYPRNSWIWWFPGERGVDEDGQPRCRLATPRKSLRKGECGGATHVGSSP